MESVKPETALPQFEYLTAASKHTRFFHYPSFLFDMQNIGMLTKNVYMLLRERSSLSQEKGYIDKNGHVYVIYTEAELAAKNHVSERTIRNALSELDAAKLIERKRLGFSAPYAIYVKVPLRKESSGMSIIEEESCRYDRKESAGMTGRKLPPSKIENSKIENKKDLDAIASASFSKPSDPFVELAGDDEALLQALKDFQEMRNKSKHPLTSRAKKLICTELQKAPRADWVAMLNQSVMNAWRGVFPLKQQPQSTRIAQKELPRL